MTQKINNFNFKSIESFIPFLSPSYINKEDLISIAQTSKICLKNATEHFGDAKLKTDKEILAANLLTITVNTKNSSSVEIQHPCEWIKTAALMKAHSFSFQINEKEIVISDYFIKLDNKLSSLANNIDNIRLILRSKDGKLKRVHFPEIVYSRLLHLFQNGSPELGFMCQDFMNYLFDIKEIRDWSKWQLITQDKDLNLSVGDAVALFSIRSSESFNQMNADHFAICMGQSMFISVIGNGLPIVFSNFNDMMEDYKCQIMMIQKPSKQEGSYFNNIFNDNNYCIEKIFYNNSNSPKKILTLLIKRNHDIEKEGLYLRSLSVFSNNSITKKDKVDVIKFDDDLFCLANRNDSLLVVLEGERVLKQVKFSDVILSKFLAIFQNKVSKDIFSHKDFINYMLGQNNWKFIPFTHDDEESQNIVIGDRIAFFPMADQSKWNENNLTGSAVYVGWRLYLGLVHNFTSIAAATPFSLQKLFGNEQNNHSIAVVRSNDVSEMSEYCAIQ